MPTTTQIIDDRSSDFTYTGNWFTDGTWTASNGQSGTLSSTNDQTASVQFTFPVPAIAFRYFGMKRSHGGLYGICVDCDPNSPSFTTINAFDGTDNGENPPSLLFSQTFSSPAVHVVIIHNKADPNGTPSGNSQLTIDRFELDIPALPASTTITIVQTSDAVNTHTQPPNGNVSGTGNLPSATLVGTPTETTPTATGSSSQVSPTTNTNLNTSSLVLSGSIAVGSLQSQSGPASAASIPSLTSPAGGVGSNGTTGPSASAASVAGGSRTSSLGAIIGGAVGGLAVIAILIVLVFWLRMRKQATSVPTPAERLGVLDTVTTSSPVSTATGGGWVTGYGIGTFEKGGHRTGFQSPESPLSPLSTSSDAHTTTSNSNLTSQSRPRELDAGPVPSHLLHSDTYNETLPPDYRQVFYDRMSDRVSHLWRRTPRNAPTALPTTSTGIGSPPLTREFALSTPALQPVRRS